MACTANSTRDTGSMTNVEELDARPFIALMNRMGLVTQAARKTREAVRVNAQ